MIIIIISRTYSNVVDPDHVGLVKGDGISTPDVLRVDVGDLDVLEDNVADAVHAKTLANNLGVVLANDGLVAGDSDTEDTGVVVLDRGRGSVRLVVGAPVVLVDSKLASRSSAPGSTTGGGGGSLGSGEVVGSREDDDTGRAVAQVAHELVGGRGVHSSGRATTGNSLSETLSGACWWSVSMEFM